MKDKESEGYKIGKDSEDLTETFTAEGMFKKR